VARRFEQVSHSYDIQVILLDTGEELIVEDSPTDYYWGCGQEKTGQNQLGQILMNVRQEIGSVCPENKFFPKGSEEESGDASLGKFRVLSLFQDSVNRSFHV
jgi:hypothetical protein